jgi:hypothetical protein
MSIFFQQNAEGPTQMKTLLWYGDSKKKKAIAYLNRKIYGQFPLFYCF